MLFRLHSISIQRIHSAARDQNDVCYAGDTLGEPRHHFGTFRYTEKHHAPRPSFRQFRLDEFRVIGKPLARMVRLDESIAATPDSAPRPFLDESLVEHENPDRARITLESTKITRQPIFHARATGSAERKYVGVWIASGVIDAIHECEED